MTTLHISQRARFVEHLSQQEEDLAARLKQQERDLLETFELHEATKKLLHAVRSGSFNRRLI